MNTITLSKATSSWAERRKENQCIGLTRLKFFHIYFKQELEVLFSFCPLRSVPSLNQGEVSNLPNFKPSNPALHHAVIEKYTRL